MDDENPYSHPSWDFEQRASFIYDLRDEELEFYFSGTLANPQDFHGFAIGLKLGNSRLDDNDSKFDEETINAWDPVYGPQNYTHVVMGLKHHARFEVLRATGNIPPPDSRRRKSTATQHLYVPGQNPPATERDGDWVNEWDTDRTAGSRWVFEETIYQNYSWTIAPGVKAHRIVYLFALVSEEGRIKKRMVVKILGGPSATNLYTELQIEYDFQSRLMARECQHILEVYGRSIRRRQHKPHLGYLFMEHAQYGSLLELARRRGDNLPQVPEPYLWLIFRGLIEGLHACQTGMIVRKDFPPALNKISNEKLPALTNWHPIFNPDIKLGNVVLGAADPQHYPAYKTAKMIDWGIAFYGNKYDTLARKTNWTGTPGLCPPEQYCPVGKQYANTPIDMKSMTFNVGLIIMSLMENEFRSATGAAARITHDKRYTRCYSKALEDLVYQYLELQSARRPGLMELLYKTMIGLEEWEKAYVDVKGEEIPGFARFDLAEREFVIGDYAPTALGGKKGKAKKKDKGKRRAAEMEEGEDDGEPRTRLCLDLEALNAAAVAVAGGEVEAPRAESEKSYSPPGAMTQIATRKEGRKSSQPELQNQFVGPELVEGNAGEEVQAPSDAEGETVSHTSALNQGIVEVERPIPEKEKGKEKQKGSPDVLERAMEMEDLSWLSGWSQPRRL